MRNAALAHLLFQFFLELWQDIFREPDLKKQAEACPLLPKTDTTSSDVARETIFQEMISRYHKVITRAEDMTVQQVCGEIEAGLRPHFIASTGYVIFHSIRIK